MAIALETLILEFEADFDKFDRQLDRATQKARTKGKEIERLVIAPRVDLEPLHKLNRLLDVKQDHLKETIALYRNNPIVPRTGSGGAGAVPEYGGSDGGASFNLDQTQVVNAIANSTKEIASRLDKLTKTTAGLETKNVGSLIFESAASKIITDIGQPFKSAYRQLNNIAGNALGKGLDSLSVSVGLELEATEGQTRISEALQQGFNKGAKQFSRVFQEELGNLFGLQLDLEGDNKPLPKRKDAVLNRIANAKSLQTSYSNEINLAKKKLVEADAKLKEFLQTDAFQSASKAVGDLQNKRDRYQKLLSKEQSKGDSQNEAKVLKLQAKIAQLERRQQRLSKSPVFKQRQELQGNVDDISFDLGSLQNKQGNNQQYLSRLKAQLKQTKTKSLRQELSKLEADSKEIYAQLKGNTLADIASKYQKLETKTTTFIKQKTAKVKQAVSREKQLGNQIAQLENLANRTPEQEKQLANLKQLKERYGNFAHSFKKQLFQAQKTLADLESLRLGEIQQYDNSGLKDQEKQLKANLNKQQAIAKELEARYNKVPRLLSDVGQMLGLNLRELEQIPSLDTLVSDLQLGAYNGTTNTLKINSQYQQDLQKSAAEVSSELVETIAHELSHGMQVGFDANTSQLVKLGVKKPRLVNNLKKMTEEEKLYIGQRLGTHYDGKDHSTKLREIDAYLTGYRVTKKAEAIQSLAQVDQKLGKAVNQFGLLKQFVTKKAQGANEQQLDQIIAAINAFQQKVKNLQKYQALSKTGGVLDPEKFAQDFETQLDEVDRYKNAVLDAVVEFEKSGELNLPDPTTGKTKKKSKRKNGIEATTNLGSAVEKLTNHSLEATNSINNLALKLQALDLVAQGKGQETYDPWSDEPHPETLTGEIVSDSKNELVRKAFTTVGKTTLDTTKALYGFAQGIENIALQAIPYGKQIKQISQVTLPVAALGAASAAVPGLGAIAGGAMETSAGLLMPAFEVGGGLLASGTSSLVATASTAVGGAIAGAIAESVPLIGQSVSASIIGALPEIGASLGSAAGTAVASGTLALGAATSTVAPAVVAGVAGKKALDSVQDKLTGNQGQAVGEQTAKALGMAANALKDITSQVQLIKTEITPLKELKSSSVGQQKHFGQKDVNRLTQGINQVNTALVAAEGDKEISSQLARYKGQLVNMLKARVKVLKAQGVEVVVDTPSLREAKARRVKQIDSKRVGQDVTKGYKQGIKSGAKEVEAVIVELGDKHTIKKLKKVIDSNSPSKKAIAIGKDFILGYAIGLRKYQKISEISRKIGHESIKGLKIGIDSHSPSKETKKEGKNYIAGFVKSIIAGYRQVKAVAKKVGATATASLKTAIGKNKFENLSLEEIELDVGSKLDELEKTISKLDKSLSSLDKADDQLSENIAKLGDGFNQDLGNQKPFAINDQQVKESGEALGKTSRQAYEGLKQLISGANFSSSTVGIFFDAFREGFADVKKGSVQVKSEFAALATAAGLVLFGGRIVEAIANLGRFQLELEGIQRKLLAIGESPASNIFDKFGVTAERAGVRVMSLANNYAELVASLRGKLPNPDELFSGLAIGLADRGVVGESQDLTMRAFSQMAGKAVVGMEELRQQAGDHLPGIMVIAAEAMGLTERAMMQLVSSGQLLASEFLPKLARELQVNIEQFPTLTKEVAKFQNTIDKLRFEATQVLPLTQAMQALNWVLSKTEGIAKPLFITLGVTAVLALGNLVVQAVIAATKIKAIGQALIFLKGALLPVLLGVAAVYTTMKAFDAITVGSARSTRKLNDELKKLANEGLKEAEEGNNNYKSSNPFVNFGSNTVGRVTSKLGFETGNQREERVNRQEIINGLDDLNTVTLRAKARVNPADLKAMESAIAADITKARDVAYKIANREAFGISQDDALKLQEQVDQINGSIEQKIELRFNAKEIEKGLADAEARLKKIDQEIANGADAEKYKPIILEIEADKASLRKDLDEIRRLTVKLTPIIEVDIRAQTLQQTIGSKLEGFTAKQELELYTKLAASQANSRVAEAKARKLAVASRKKELELIKQQQKQALSTVGLLSSPQKDRLAELLGTDDFGAVTQEQVEAAKLKLAQEEKAGVIPDEALNKAIAQLDNFADNSARAAKIKAEEAKAAYELVNTIKELAIEFASLKVERLQKALEVRELGRDARRFFDSDRIFAAQQNLRTQSQQLADTVYNQNEAFADAVRGVQDFAHGIKKSAQDLTLQLARTGREMYATAIQSVSTQLSAAGIEDYLGFNKVRELLSKSASIANSDRSEQIKLEIKDSDRSFQRQRQDQERQQTRLNRDVNRSVFDLQNQQIEDIRRSDFESEDLELDFDRLKLRFLETQNTLNQFDRNVEGFNLTSKEYGLDSNVAPLNYQLPPIESFGSPEELFSYLEGINSQIQQVRSDTISQIRAIQTRGNRDLDREQAETETLFKEQNALKQKELELEGQRVKQENQNLLKEVDGVFFQLGQKLESQIGNFQSKGVEARKAIADIFTGAGISRDYQSTLNLIVDTKTLEIDRKITELKQLQEKLDEYLKIEKPDELLKLIASDNLKGLDPSFKAGLIEKLKSLSGGEDFKAVLGELANLNRDLDLEETLLQNHRDKIVKGETANFKRKGDRRIEDVDGDIAQAKLDSQFFLTDTVRAKLQIELDESKAKVDVERQIQDLVGELPTETLEKLRDRLEQLNQIKYGKLRKELTLTFKITKAAKDALESSLTGLFTNIGESLFQGGDKQKQILEINAEYGEKLRNIQEKYADDPAQLAKAAERLDMLNDVKLDAVKSEFSVFRNIVQTVKDAVVGFAQEMVAALAKIAAQKAIGAIFGGGFSQGGEVGKPGTVQNFSLGGEVINPYGEAIRKAMVREGNGAIPIVAHAGEQILSTRNGDAQLQRALVKSGEWRRLKSLGISNFSLGGTVGGVSNDSIRAFDRNSARGSNRGSITINNNYHTKVMNENQMRKTQDQLIAAARRRDERTVQRNT